MSEKSIPIAKYRVGCSEISHNGNYEEHPNYICHKCFIEAGKFAPMDAFGSLSPHKYPCCHCSSAISPKMLIGTEAGYWPVYTKNYDELSEKTIIKCQICQKKTIQST